MDWGSSGKGKAAWRDAYLQLSYLFSQLVYFYIEASVLLPKKEKLLSKLAYLSFIFITSAVSRACCYTFFSLQMIHVLLLSRKVGIFRLTRDDAPDWGRPTPKRWSRRDRPDPIFDFFLFPLKKYFLSKLAITDNLHAFFLLALDISW